MFSLLSGPPSDGESASTSPARDGLARSANSGDARREQRAARLQSPMRRYGPRFADATRTLVVLDLVELVRLYELDEEGTMHRWEAFVREVETQLLPQWGGRLVKGLGDGLIVEFPAVSRLSSVPSPCRACWASSMSACETICTCAHGSARISPTSTSTNTSSTGAASTSRLGSLRWPNRGRSSSQVRVRDLLVRVSIPMSSISARAI